MPTKGKKPPSTRSAKRIKSRSRSGQGTTTTTTITTTKTNVGRRKRSTGLHHAIHGFDKNPRPTRLRRTLILVHSTVRHLPQPRSEVLVDTAPEGTSRGLLRQRHRATQTTHQTTHCGRDHRDGTPHQTQLCRGCHRDNPPPSLSPPPQQATTTRCQRKRQGPPCLHPHRHGNHTIQRQGTKP